MRRSATSLLLASTLLLAAGCDRRPAQADRGDENAVTVDVPKAVDTDAGVTPMAERVAVLGFLNKRNGIVRDLTLKPGQAIRIRDAVIRLRACETSAPWENEQLTGAFVQLDVQRPDNQWGRVFSGWLYKESPSLNVVEHPVYDVWPKSCAMKFPDGPAAPASPRASSSASSAKKSGGSSTPAAGTGADAPASTQAPPVPEAVEPIEPDPNAAPSNPT